MATKSAGKSTKSKRPYNWDKAVSVAHSLCLGDTQEEAAKAAGVGERTIRDWIHTDWWPRAQLEANTRWLAGVTARTKRGILEGLGDPNEYATMSRWAAERIIPEMAPPKQKQEVSGPEGKPIEVSVAPDMSKLSTEELYELKRITDKVTAG